MCSQIFEIFFASGVKGALTPNQNPADPMCLSVALDITMGCAGTAGTIRIPFAVWGKGNRGGGAPAFRQNSLTTCFQRILSIFSCAIPRDTLRGLTLVRAL